MALPITTQLNITLGVLAVLIIVSLILIFMDGGLIWFRIEKDQQASDRTLERIRRDLQRTEQDD